MLNIFFKEKILCGITNMSQLHSFTLRRITLISLYAKMI